MVYWRTTPVSARRRHAVSHRWPRVEYKEEGMRDGIQIEDAAISVDDKVRLLEALSDAGLKHIVVGSFVRPEYTPQMDHIEEILERFQPRPGVKYTALLVNERAVERARQFSPPLTIEEREPMLAAHLCDVFPRRNYNRSRQQELDGWPRIVARAKERGASGGGIGVHAAWGSNFTGEHTLAETMETLARGHALWDEAEIPVVSVYVGDPMSWNTPHRVEEYLAEIKDRWPDIHQFHVHLHNARGMAVVSSYAALRTLAPDDTVFLEGSFGGIGGCPYCGNGRATGMAPTEDLMHMLEAMGVDTGVDIDRLVECVWMLEEVLGRQTMGHVSKAGPRPTTPDRWYDPNMPFVETFREAGHFRLGPEVYAGQRRPWKEPICSPQRPDAE